MLKGREILAATQGELIKGQLPDKVFRISLDSRQIKPGEIFLALKGQKFDGHSFVLPALKKGAAGVIVTRWDKKILAQAPFLIQVKDTLKALQSMAAFFRERISSPLVAITGSNGKTTTKEMTAWLLSARYLTYKNPGNFNNQIGLPISLLDFHPKKHQVGVFELGMNHLGEIKNLAAILKPQIGVVTNVGPVHLAYLKTVDRVAQAKAELVEALGEKDFAVLNADDPRVKKMRKLTRAKIITFGLAPNAEVKAEEIKEEAGEKTEFTLIYQQERIKCTLSLLGRYNVMNALGAISVALVLKVDLEKIKEKLASFSPPASRMEIIERAGVVILNDSYNANPCSMRAALGVLDRFKGKRKIAVLGEMLELGEESEFWHREIGRFINQTRIGVILTKGKKAALINEEIKNKGKETFSYLTSHFLRQRLRKIISPGDVVLIKGSRGMRMEEVIF